MSDPASDEGLRAEQAIVDVVQAEISREQEDRKARLERERQRVLTQKITTAGPALQRMEQKLHQAQCVARGDPPYFARVKGHFEGGDAVVRAEDVRVSAFPCLETWRVEGRDVDIPSFRSGIAEIVRDPDAAQTGPWDEQGAQGRVRVIEAQVEDVEIRGGRVLRTSPRYTSVFEDRVSERLAEANRHGVDNMLDVLDQEQNRLLNRGAVPLMIVEGAAGTGKTVVALHYAAMRAEPGSTGLYLTPTRTLAEYLRPGLPALGFPHPTLDVQSYEDFVRQGLGVDALPTVGARRTSSAALRAIKVNPDILWPHLDRAHGAVAGRAEKLFRELLAAVLQVLRATLPDAADRLALVSANDGGATVDVNPERLLTGPLPGWSAPYSAQVGAVIRALQPLAATSPVATALLSQDAALKLQQQVAEAPLAVYREALASACREHGGEPDTAIAFEDLAGIARAARLAQRVSVAPDYLLIDEAHAFSAAAFQMLGEMVPASTRIVLMGDLNQRPAGGLPSWSTAMAALHRPQAPVVTLDKTYRVPQQVQRYSTRVLGRYAVGSVGNASSLQVPGDKPERVACLSPEGIEATATSIVRESEQNGLGQLVVLAPDPDRARELARKMGVRMSAGPRKRPRDIEVVDGARAYGGKLAISWTEAFSGMEADVVIVTDVDNAKYPDDADSARRLYVACSRAKRRLVILPLQTPTPEERKALRAAARTQVRALVADRMIAGAGECEQAAARLGGGTTDQSRKSDLHSRASRMRRAAKQAATADDREFLGFLEKQVYDIPGWEAIVAERPGNLEAPFLPERRMREYAPSPLLAAADD